MLVREVYLFYKYNIFRYVKSRVLLVVSGYTSILTVPQGTGTPRRNRHRRRRFFRRRADVSRAAVVAYRPGPYDAIMFDEEIGIARKCNLCYDRVTKGLYPACADNVCLAHCIYFGDPEEIEAAIAEKRRTRADRSSTGLG